MNADFWWTVATAGGTWLGIALACTFAFSRARPRQDRESIPPTSFSTASRIAVPLGDASASARE